MRHILGLQVELDLCFELSLRLHFGVVVFNFSIMPKPTHGALDNATGHLQIQDGKVNLRLPILAADGFDEPKLAVHDGECISSL